MGELSVRTFTLRLSLVFLVFVWTPMTAMQRQLQLLPPQEGSAFLQMRTSFVRPPMQAVRQQLLPPQEGSLLFRTGTYLFAVGPAELEQFVTLHTMKEDTEENSAPIPLACNPATFGTVLTCFRASLANEDYSQRVANVTKILQRTTTKQANNILHALDFLDAKQGPFSTAFLLRYAAVNPTIAAHLGKPYDELPQDIREVMSRGAYDSLNSMLRHALTEPNFTIEDPPQSLAPLAQEVLKNKNPRTPGEIRDLLLAYRADWRFLACLPSTTYLKKLDLSDKELTSLPPEISDLPNLVELCLHFNKLTSLPDKIGYLGNLEKLRLEYNNLGSLPESVARMTGLRVLVLYDNHLSSLPESVARMTGLRVLVLHDNNLSSLSKSVAGMTGLKELSLDNNILTPDELTRIRETRPSCRISSWYQR